MTLAKSNPKIAQTHSCTERKRQSFGGISIAVKSNKTHNPRDAVAVRPRWLCFEALEARLLLSVSAEEQYFVYLLNRARHDPVAYQRQAGLPVDLSQIAPRPPLAVNDQLMRSADQRADEMACYDYIGHHSPVTKAWPNQVARSHGYALPSAWPNDNNFIESIAAGDWYDRADVPLDALIIDQGLPSATHRRHLLGVDGFYAENREIGIGFASEPNSTYDHYWTVHIARREEAGTFLTGVVFEDGNGNGRYDSGEGLPRVSIETIGLATLTNDAGGFSLAVPANGWYRIRASGPGLAVPVTGSVLVAEANVHVDILSGIRGVYVGFADRPTSAWTNPRDRFDVSNNQVVDPLDALQVINHLNTAGPGELAEFDPSDETLPPLLDVDGDGRVLPHDALYVINYLNRPDGSGEGEPEGRIEAARSSWFPPLAFDGFGDDPSDPMVSVPTRFDPRPSLAADVFPRIAWPASGERGRPAPIGTSRLASELGGLDDTFDTLLAPGNLDDLLTEIALGRP